MSEEMAIIFRVSKRAIEKIPHEILPRSGTTQNVVGHPQRKDCYHQ